MSSSDEERRFGTIFMGPTPDRETTLDHLSDIAKRDLWNKQTQEEYLERVKAKATERVRELLVNAKGRAEEIRAEARADVSSIHAEAEARLAEANRLKAEAESLRAEAQAMKDAAHQTGLQDARAEARKELEETRRALGETSGIVLLGILEQCAHIFEAWRKDLADLLREAVEKTTGWVATHEREAMFDALLKQSMRALLDRRRFTVRVNPVDAELLTDMLADAHATQWELATDPKLEPGSLIVESDSALIDNSRAARRSVVDEILANLSIPAGKADEDALAGVRETLTREMGTHGINLDDFFEGDAPVDDDHLADDHPINDHPAAAPLPAETPSGALLPEVSSDTLADDVLPNALHDEFSADAASATDAPPAAIAEPQEAPDIHAPVEDVTAPPAVGALSEATADAGAAVADGGLPLEISAEPLEDNSVPALLPQDERDDVQLPAEHAAQDEPQCEADEAENMVQEFLGPGSGLNVSLDGPAGAEPQDALPGDLADELLAEMGFSQDKNG